MLRRTTSKLLPITLFQTASSRLHTCIREGRPPITSPSSATKVTKLFQTQTIGITGKSLYEYGIEAFRKEDFQSGLKAWQALFGSHFSDQQHLIHLLKLCKDLKINLHDQYYFDLLVINNPYLSHMVEALKQFAHPHFTEMNKAIFEKILINANQVYKVLYIKDWLKKSNIDTKENSNKLLGHFKAANDISTLLLYSDFYKDTREARQLFFDTLINKAVYIPQIAEELRGNVSDGTVINVSLSRLTNMITSIDNGQSPESRHISRSKRR